ncbi:MAG: hypothetical protein K2I22_04345 [Lachnospiraceae bacterium]|nr:hypothetical protein [Lachnospiraceae bacterium]
MRATKGNKTYTITEQEKRRYVEAGYDIQSDSGETISYGRGRTVPMEQYVALEEKYKNLDERNAELAARCHELEELLESRDGSGENSPDFDSRNISGMSVEELKTYAEERQIDIGKTTSRDGILEKIKAAMKQDS